MFSALLGGAEDLLLGALFIEFLADELPVFGSGLPE